MRRKSLWIVIIACLHGCSGSGGGSALTYKADRTTDPRELAQIALHDESILERHRAITRLDDRQVLLPIALRVDEHDGQAAVLATQRLRERQDLLEVALRGGFAASSEAVRRLNGDTEALMQIAGADGNRAAAEMALEALRKDQQALARVLLARCDKPGENRVHVFLKREGQEQAWRTTDHAALKTSLALRLGYMQLEELLAPARSDDARLDEAIAVLCKYSPNQDVARAEVAALGIRRGDAKRIPLLLRLLEASGQRVAGIYLNCGESTLEAAARGWAGANGYRIHTFPVGGGGGPRWGGG